MNTERPDQFSGLPDGPGCTSRAYQVNRHGYARRYRLCVPRARAMEALQRCGWVVEPRSWRRYEVAHGRVRHVLRGGVSLRNRAPRNRRLSISKKNGSWETAFYDVVIEEGPADLYVDLKGVRSGDPEMFFELVLGLSPDEYELCYHRVAEVYVALSPREALRLGRELGYVPRMGAGSQARKKFLVKDYPVDVTIRSWAKATAFLTVYRVERGATAAYKAELRLVGNRSRRGEFHEGDVVALEQALRSFVAAHQLDPIAKPHRWEPVDLSSRPPRAPDLAGLSASAWRGRAMPAETIEGYASCHTPSTVALAYSRGKAAVDRFATRIRSPRKASSSDVFDDSSRSTPATVSSRGDGHSETTHPIEPVHASPPDDARIYHDNEIVEVVERSPCHDAAVAPPLHASDVHEIEHELLKLFESERDLGSFKDDGVARLADYIAASSGYQHEVILREDENPAAVIRALAATDRTIAVTAIGAVEGERVETWGPVETLMREHPVRPETDILVVVVDPSAVAGMADALVTVRGEDDEMEVVPGPMVRTTSSDAGRYMSEPVASLLWEPMKNLRDLCEETGFTLVWITVDTRPAHAFGPVTRWHRYRDARVRSSVGDAGRNHAHARYRFEETASGRRGPAVMIKDEIEGLCGRYV